MSKYDFLILGLLNRRAIHGYEIIKMIEDERAFSTTKFSTSSLYKAINRLEEQDFITGEKKYDDKNPPRIIYSITTRGNKYFRKMVRQSLQTIEFPPHKFFLAIAFMYKTVPREFFVKALDKRLEIMPALIAKHKERIDQFDEETSRTPTSFNQRVMRQWGHKMFKLHMDTLKRLKEEALKPENQSAFIEDE